MKTLWIAVILVATLGSIYPFNFEAAGLDSAKLLAFLQSCCRMPGRGDVVGNVILFVPYGFTGMFAVRPDGSERQRFLTVLWIGAAIAFALQLAQFFLPSRDENLQDVLWNTIGLLFGAALAIATARLSGLPRGGMANASIVPLTLVGAWLVFRLIPFVPSLDFQLIKDSLKPLFALQLVPVNVAHDLAAWLVVAYLLRHAQRAVRLDAYLPILVGVVFSLEVIILSNVVTASNALGALLAIGLWLGVLGRLDRHEGTLVFLLVFVIAVGGLAPFVARMAPADFNWLPFHGFLGGSMYVNAQSAVEKVFLYGSLVYLLWKMNVSRLASVFVATAFVALVEFLQIHFVGHTPEITDPLLVVFAALTLMALERSEWVPAVIGPRRDEGPARAGRLADNLNSRKKFGTGRWVAQEINFRRDQYEFLSQLSKESSRSVSRLVRKIVAQFMAELEKETGGTSGELVDGSDSNAAAPPATDTQTAQRQIEWNAQTINFRRDQFEFLSRLAQEMGVSVSRATRRIVGRFIEHLDDSVQ